MKILRVNDDHYVVENRAQFERHVLVLLNQRLASGQVPPKARNLAYSCCEHQDGETGYHLLRLTDDVALIPTKVL